MSTAGNSQHNQKKMEKNEKMKKMDKIKNWQNLKVKKKNFFLIIFCSSTFEGLVVVLYYYYIKIIELYIWYMYQDNIFRVSNSCFFPPLVFQFPDKTLPLMYCSSLLA